MATLPVKSFTAVVQSTAAAMQGAATAVLDFSVGSVLRALVEGVAGVALWLQAMILQLLLTTRASTSTGSDLDTWVQDWGVTRLAASSASGLVTFSRFTYSAAATIPIGAQVRTSDGTQTYTVTLDQTNTLYDKTSNSYILPVGVQTGSVPVVANVPSAASNVAAASITTIVSPIPGIDTVTNAGAMTGGGDAETDEALRARFVLFIGSLSKATNLAIQYAVNSLHLAVQSTITEFQNYTDNSARPGYFYVVIDDGTGTPPQSLLDLASAQINQVRALGVQVDVFAPVILRADVLMTITTASGYDHATVVGLVGTAITTYINTLPLGQTLSYHKLAQIVFNASPGVSDITSFLINGSQGDIFATNKNIVKVNSVAVS